MRKEIFEEGIFYHVFNRGVDKRDIFLNKNDLERFYESLRLFNTQECTGGMWGLSDREMKTLYQSQELVDIVAYCLNHNHFHLLLKQKTAGGISKFMERIGKGYTQHFNKKHDRNGSLFQGPFKAVLVEEGDSLDYVGVYVNRNDEVHRYGRDRKEFVKRSHDEYRTSTFNVVSDTYTLLRSHKNQNTYNQFSDQILKQILQNKVEKKIRKLLLT